MPKNYGTWSLATLKAELRKRNARVTGRKAALVQRLLDYDVMFGGLINDPDISYRINTPDPEHFLDINSTSVVPNITEADIQQYSELGERENQMTSKNMYNEGYLIASRIAHSANSCFVTAVCAAEMRKNVTYNVTLKIQPNLVLESQCECTAGMGPHSQCKHVIVLLYGLLDFSLNKKMNIRASSTSNLQTFHQPPHQHTGEPVMAKNLNLKTIIIKQITIFDPRTNVVSEEKYKEMFCNMATNFAASQAALQRLGTPIFQLRKPANKVALNFDHDYFEKTGEDMFLESNTLTVQKISDLERHTCNNKKMWKQVRCMRLQSSNFGKICKSTATNQNQLAKSFLKSKDFITAATKHGIKYEKQAIEKMAQITGMHIKKCGIFVHPQHQFLASTPDGIIGDHAVVEVKCPYSAINKKICPETVPYLYLCDATGQFLLKENSDYYHQIQGQLLCTGRRECFFGIYTISDFHMIKVGRNDEFIKHMLTKLIQFYNNNFRRYFLYRYFYNIKF